MASKGGVGLMPDWEKSATIAFKAEGELILLLGGAGTHLGQSIWLRETQGREDGPAPAVDLTKERQIGEAIRQLIAEGAITAAHDVSDGGVAVALAEMALAGGIGADVGCSNTDKLPAHWFGEDQGRYIVTTTDRDLEWKLRNQGINVLVIGGTGGTNRQTGAQELIFRVEAPAATVSAMGIPLADLRRAHEGFFPALMNATSPAS